MKNLRSRGILATVAVASMLLFIGDAVHAESRPFRMSSQGHANPLPTADPCVLTNSETGTGQALHLGAMTWTSNEVVNLCAEGGPEVRAEFVLIAANGDRLFGRLRTLANFDFAANQITFAGLWTIDGGTGRFVNAEGEGTLTGFGSLLPPFEVTAQFSGELKY